MDLRKEINWEPEDKMYKNMSTGNNRRRNPKATCTTCPYFWVSENDQWKDCRRQCPTNFNPKYPQVSEINWCGEHPDFWMEES